MLLTIVSIQSTILLFFLLGVGTGFWYAREVPYWRVSQESGWLFRLGSLYGAIGVVSSFGFVLVILSPIDIPTYLAVVPVYLGFVVLYWRNISDNLPPIHRWSLVNKLYKGTVILSVTALLLTPLVIGISLSNPVVIGMWPIAAVPVTWAFRQEVSQSKTQQASSEYDEDAKNVIFCMVDDLRRDRTSLHDYERSTTPFLETLVEETEPLVFDNCISPSTRSGHSIPSLLSGTHASVHEYCANVENLRLLPDEFADSGYSTAGLSSNPHVTPTVFGDRFDWFAHFDKGTNYLFQPQRYLLSFLNRLGLRHFPVHYFAREASFFHDVTEAYIEDQLERKQPFFLYINYMDVHEPYVREFEHISQFAAEHDTSVSRGSWMTNTEPYRKALWYDKNIKDWGYDETIRYVDSQLKRLYDFLEEKEIRDETIVVITSDHGELLGEQGCWGHIDIPYNCLVEVPLIVDTSNDLGGTVTETVSGVQIPSLLLELAGVEPSNEMESQWTSKLTRTQLNNNELAGTALVDFHSEEINTKGYTHPFTNQVIDRESETAVTQRLLIKEKWKTLQIDNNRYFFEYDDAFLENPIPPSEVPAEIREELVDGIKGYEKVFNAHESSGKSYYQDMTDSRVRNQLEELGYL